MFSNNTNTEEGIDIGYVIILIFIPIAFISVSIHLCIQAKKQGVELRGLL